MIDACVNVVDLGLYLRWCFLPEFKNSIELFVAIYTLWQIFNPPRNNKP